jgi:hypothetical protein
MAAGSGMRVGDAERNAAAESLREHYAAGRLTMEEFQERLDATFAAKTDLDLDKLTEDLPHTTSYSAPWPPGNYGPVQPYPRTGGQQAPPRSGSWPSTVAGVAAVISFFLVASVVIFLLPFGGLPKTILLILAVFAFIRRIFRRVFLGATSVSRSRR